MPPSENSLWGEYPNTVLSFYSTPRLVVDLRQPVSASSRAAMLVLGFERSFGIVTACNPRGVTQPDAVNDGLVASLQKDIAGLKVLNVSVAACSADGLHCERSLAVALDQDSLIAVAVRYEQLAIFWFDGEAFWIIPACSSTPRLRLPARA